MSEYETLYRAGVDLVVPLIQEGDDERATLSPGNEACLRRGIDYLKRSLDIVPTSWPAMWAIGKAYQALCDEPQSCAWFERACEFDHGNPDVYREASIQAARCGKGDKAELYSRAALQLKPTDAGLMSNHAIGLLLNQKPAEAKVFAERACALAPEDPINAKVLDLIGLVLSGEIDCPTSLP